MGDLAPELKASTMNNRSEPAFSSTTMQSRFGFAYLGWIPGTARVTVTPTAISVTPGFTLRLLGASAEITHESREVGVVLSKMHGPTGSCMLLLGDAGRIFLSGIMFTDTQGILGALEKAGFKVTVHHANWWTWQFAPIRAQIVRRRGWI